MISRHRASSVSLTVLAASAVALLSGCAADPVAPATAPTPTFAAPMLAASAPSAPPVSSSATERVVTLGDSLMSGFGLSPRDAWPLLLAERAHISLTNLACPGMGFVVQGDCGTPYAGLVPAIAALQPDVLIVQSSSNDFWEDPDEIRYSTADTVDSLHAAAPGARIVALSTIWNDDPQVPDDTAVTSEALRDAVQAIGGTYIDLRQPLAGHPEWMQDDDVHPTARGQRAIEQTVMSALQEAGVLP
ncbi:MULTISPECIES: SGNH/GDSL hydrolase family protein [Microbacterium]|uniref:SGNH/GDSL hydrolase family protein n=1 Tax=Microbacterium TaxID=33882 RepID=UPI00278438E7|nr:MULTISPECIES: SGNH/GDSL hydrolase family protein [Microbacterium]MDQ1083998.1 acyl-CoA thioesterase-1 [Microbacterium sp. SORGH_AS_0344]MDQ1170722.1 acyl-CoA thioesterase-1 [Microbacterium proteolyticum]